MHKSKFQGDRWGSTFKHCIFLDPTNRQNSGQLVLEGYSKDRRSVESPDKDFLLTTQIMRGCLPYLIDNRALRVEIYFRPDKTFFWDNAHHILTLYRDEFTIESQVDISNRVLTSLTSFYTRIREGKELDDLKPKSNQKGRSYEKTLDDFIRYRSFTTLEDLITYCRNRKEEGYNYDILKKFYFSYCTKYFPDAEKEIGSNPKKQEIKNIADSVAKKFTINKK